MKKNARGIAENIPICLEYLSQLTKDEAELIKDVIAWEQDLKAAFIIAKQIFEDHNTTTPTFSSKMLNKSRRKAESSTCR